MANAGRLQTNKRLSAEQPPRLLQRACIHTKATLKHEYCLHAGTEILYAPTPQREPDNSPELSR